MPELNVVVLRTPKITCENWDLNTPCYDLSVVAFHTEPSTIKTGWFNIARFLNPKTSLAIKKRADKISDKNGALFCTTVELPQETIDEIFSQTVCKKWFEFWKK